jgi:hypothetical protein
VKYFWTLFWTFLLIHMVTYVVSSMIGTHYDFGTATTLAIITAILILIVPSILPNDPVEKTHH